MGTARSPGDEDSVHNCLEDPFFPLFMLYVLGLYGKIA